jgi:glycerol kinase
MISGLTRGTTRTHLARAAFDAVAYQVRDVIEALRDVTPTPAFELIADGGAAQSSLLMQTQADVLGLPILRARSVEAAGLGAAYLAGLAIGWWGSVDAVRALSRTFDRFEPDPRAAAAAEQGYAGWKQALERALRGVGNPAMGVA